MLFRTLILQASALPFVKRFVRESRLFRPIVRRFIAGETLDDAMSAARSLVDEGFRVSLDLLGENVATLDEAHAATAAYQEVLDRIAASPQREMINISIKLTALGLDQGDHVAESNYRDLLQTATKSGTFVRADMEASEYTARTVEMVESVHRSFPNTGTVLQSYLYRTDNDLERLIAAGIRVRIVKGAYLEPPEVAFPEKSDVDAKYLEQAKKLLLRGHYPAIASQDEGLINRILQFVEARGIEKDRFEFQMLYGIRRDLQHRLLAAGYRVRIYIPYGEAWYPYFSRRLAERPANLLFITRSLLHK